MSRNWEDTLSAGDKRILAKMAAADFLDVVVNDDTMRELVVSSKSENGIVTIVYDFNLMPDADFKMRSKEFL